MAYETDTERMLDESGEFPKASVISKYRKFIPAKTNLDSPQKLLDYSKSLDALLVQYINHHPFFLRKFDGPKNPLSIQYKDSKRGKLNYAFAGGKRMRPILMKLVCDWLGKEFSPLVPAAVAIEMVHKSSLVLDDIRDEYGKENPKLRDGKLPLCIEYNHKHTGPAIASEFCLHMLQSAKRHLDNAYKDKRNGLFLRDFDKVTERMIEGQIDENQQSIKNYDEYLKIVDQKTGSLPLLTVLMPIGYYCNELPQEDVPAIKEIAKEWALNYGRLFQIADDILDLDDDNAKETSSLNVVDVIVLEFGVSKLEALTMAREKADQLKKALVYSPFNILNIELLPLNIKIN